LLLITDGKWHTASHITLESLTLDDLEGHWQPIRLAILAIARLLMYSVHITSHIRVIAEFDIRSNRSSLIYFWRAAAML